jgi:hypothetical protein
LWGGGGAAHGRVDVPNCDHVNEVRHFLSLFCFLLFEQSLGYNLAS